MTYMYVYIHAYTKEVLEDRHKPVGLRQVLGGPQWHCWCTAGEREEGRREEGRNRHCSNNLCWWLTRDGL